MAASASKQPRTLQHLLSSRQWDSGLIFSKTILVLIELDLKEDRSCGLERYHPPLKASQAFSPSPEGNPIFIGGGAPGV
jgi:hypothetical protein